MEFSGKNTGVGCHSLLQGIVPTQGSNPGLSHCRQILCHLSHQGSWGEVRCGGESVWKEEETDPERGIHSKLLEASTVPSKGTAFKRAHLRWLPAKPEETKLPMIHVGNRTWLWKEALDRASRLWEHMEGGVLSEKEGLPCEACQGTRRRSWKSEASSVSVSITATKQSFIQGLPKWNFEGDFLQVFEVRFGDTDNYIFVRNLRFLAQMCLISQGLGNRATQQEVSSGQESRFICIYSWSPMRLNDPETNPPHCPQKNCLPRNQPLVSTRLGTAVLTNPAVWNVDQISISSSDKHICIRSALPAGSTKNTVLWQKAFNSYQSSYDLG